MIDVIFISMIVILILIFILMVLYYEYYMELKTLAQYMEYKTVFYNKRNPLITCVIEKVYWHDLFNQRIILNVTYQSGHKVMLQTNINELYNIWEKYKET